MFVKGHRPDQDLLIGAVSWGPTNCQERPSVDTNVAQLRPWIDQVIEELVPFVPLDGAREWDGWAGQGLGALALQDGMCSQTWPASACAHHIRPRSHAPTPLRSMHGSPRPAVQPQACCPHGSPPALPAVYANSMGRGFDGKEVFYGAYRSRAINVRAQAAAGSGRVPHWRWP